MIPGIKYSPERLITAAWGNRWLLLGGLVVGAAIATGVGRMLPARYKSQAVILVVPQRVPESYIRSTVAARIEDRVKTISQEILGQTWLQGLIEEFDLYPDIRRTRGMDDAIYQMRVLDTKIQFLRGDAFAVSYNSHDPLTAQKIAARLAADFVSRNVNDRIEVADATAGFLDAELKDKQQLLVDSERKLEEYRRRHSTDLPTQLPANQQALQNTQIQVQALIDSMNRDKDRRIVVQRELADLQADLGVSTPTVDRPGMPAGAAAAQPVDPLVATQLSQAQETLRDLLTRYKDSHPDVSAARRRLKELEDKYAAEQRALANRPADAPQPLPVSPAARAQANRIRQLRNDIENIDRQLAAKQEQESRLRGQIAEYQRRIDASPMRETELVQLSRDYQTLNEMYINLLHRREDAKLAAKVENGQVGQQFKVIDPARVPSAPFFPNIPLMAAFGGGLGLALAALFVAWREYRDATLRTEDEVMSCIGLPVIAVIPVMTRAITPAPSGRLRRLLPWGGTAAILLPAVLAIARFWA